VTKNDGFESTIFLDELESRTEEEVTAALAEMRSATAKNVLCPLSLGTNVKNRESGWDRQWWETRFLQAGFRKHPLSMRLQAYESAAQSSSPVMLAFEKIPDAVLARHPLEALKKERDLHMDMLRESGARSDAHLARYQMAAESDSAAAIVVDAACGLGYGSAMLAHQLPQATVIGIDNSDTAIGYARECYAAFFPNLEFHKGDVCDLRRILGRRDCNLLVSFETIEHIPDPDRFLAEAAACMYPGGRFIGSVPNLWIDADGSPGPYHRHIFDFSRFQSLVDSYFRAAAYYRQNAEGGLKGDFGRILRRLENGKPNADDLNKAEWWIVVARR
jgi:2-polyprenyl-3-methyl-5-hydroxy-6-metoxy-1,4-benzoquinol methylase